MSGFARDARLVVGPPPRVDLLPPEVGAARRAGAARRGMFVALAAVVVVSGVAVGGAYFAENKSATALAASQAQSSQLLAQQAAYSAVTTAQAKVAAGTIAQKAALADYVDWKSYLTHIQADLPAGMALTSFSFVTADGASSTAGATASGAAAATSVTVPSNAIATITMSASVTDLQSIQTWLGALASLRGYLDVTPNAITSAGNGLQVQVTLHLSPAAHTTRHVAALPSESSTVSTNVAATPTPTPSVSVSPSESATPAASASPSVAGTEGATQ